MSNHTSGNDKTEPTLQEQLEEILNDYKTTLFQQMGFILSARHRLDIKTADKMLIETPTTALTTLIEKAERKARIDELNNLYDEAETPEQYDTCDVVHDHRIAERIKELSDKGVDNE